MRRRVATIFRRGLLLIGLLLVVSLPVSFFYAAWIGNVESTFEWSVQVSDGAIWVGSETFREPKQGYLGVFYGVEATALIDYYPYAFLPSYEDDFYVWPGVTQLTVPLWLLAFLCLVWPITSFIVTRRKLKRGFPVVPSTGGPTQGRAGLENSASIVEPPPSDFWAVILIVLCLCILQALVIALAFMVLELAE